MDVLTMLTTYGVAAVAVLAFTVSVITEVIKNVWFVKKIPTDVVVIFLSIVITTGSYFCVNAYHSRAFHWYELVATIISSFVVAFIAMNGWDKLNDLWLRFKK